MTVHDRLLRVAQAGGPGTCKHNYVVIRLADGRRVWSCTRCGHQIRGTDAVELPA